MLREQAINYLRSSGMSEEQINGVVEGLTCEDAVSRQAVLDLIADYDLSMGQVVRGIHALPSVTPKQRTGKWIGHREHCENLGVMPSGLGAYEWCSNCDCGIDVREWHRNHYNFCPNCGARMKGVSE